VQPVLEVAIGLTLLMVVFSVIVSATVETISMVMSQRATYLTKGITNMLGGGNASEIAERVLNHPLITAFSKPRRKPSRKQRKPAYIDSGVFSAALLDELLHGVTNIDAAIGAIENEQLKKRLLAVRRTVGDDIDEFRGRVETWFDQQMDRVSGWYTRWAQWVMLATGIAAALALNVSAVTVARVLWNDPVLRTELVTEAERAASTPTDTGEPTDGEADDEGSTDNQPNPEETADPATAVGTKVELSRFPVGWNDTAWPGINLYLLLHLLGILGVGLAASLGAPFWFDALSKLANLRTTGPKPRSTTQPAS
jgi:hypothetical protein